MKKFIFLGVIFIFIVGLYFYKKANTEKEKRYKPVKASYELVSQYIETTGQAEPLNRVEILPPSGGRIEKILVEEGQNVSAGDVLALMSSSDRVAILDAARAISEEEYKKWEDVYKPIKIISPLSGRIILRNVVEGQTVNASTVLFAISDILIVVANVDESDIGKIKLNQKAFIRFDAYPDVELTGKTFQILDEGKNSNNVIIYKVKIKLDNIPAFVKSQMTASIKIQVLKAKKALLIPQSGVVYARDGKTYVVVGFDNKKNPVQKPVELGNEYGDKIEIIKGLSEGEEIYIELKNYVVQKKDTTTSPFMPKRPQGQARQAMRMAR